MAINLVKPRLMTWNSISISDHNRSPLSVAVERIETSKRMANGTMRKYWVADKRTFSCSWSMLPNSNLYTVDGHAGADVIENIYDSTQADFILRLYVENSAMEVYTVMFTDFSKTLTKRGKFDMYDVDVTMEEV